MSQRQPRPPIDKTFRPATRRRRPPGRSRGARSRLPVPGSGPHLLPRHVRDPVLRARRRSSSTVPCGWAVSPSGCSSTRARRAGSSARWSRRDTSSSGATTPMTDARRPCTSRRAGGACYSASPTDLIEQQKQLLQDLDPEVRDGCRQGDPPARARGRLAVPFRRVGRPWWLCCAPVDGEQFLRLIFSAPIVVTDNACRRSRFELPSPTTPPAIAGDLQPGHRGSRRDVRDRSRGPPRTWPRGWPTRDTFSTLVVAVDSGAGARLGGSQRISPSRPATPASPSSRSTWTAHARGRGVGRQLLIALVDAARERGYWKLVSRIFPFNAAQPRDSAGPADFAKSASTKSTAGSTANGSTSSSSND